jgi:hypothetical protein
MNSASVVGANKREGGGGVFDTLSRIEERCVEAQSSVFSVADFVNLNGHRDRSDYQLSVMLDNFIDNSNIQSRKVETKQISKILGHLNPKTVMLIDSNCLLSDFRELSGISNKALSIIVRPEYESCNVPAGRLVGREQGKFGEIFKDSNCIAYKGRLMLCYYIIKAIGVI